MAGDCQPIAVIASQTVLPLLVRGFKVSRDPKFVEKLEYMTPPERVNLDGFLDGWFSAQTQAALKATLARLKKPH